MTKESTSFKAALDCVNLLLKDPAMESFRGRLHIVKGHLMDGRPLSTSLYFEFAPERGGSNKEGSPSNEVTQALETLQRLLAPCQLTQQKSYQNFVSLTSLLHDMLHLNDGPYYNALEPKLIHPSAPKQPQQDQDALIERVMGCMQGLYEISAHLDKQDTQLVESILKIHSQMIDAIVCGENVTPPQTIDAIVYEENVTPFIPKEIDIPSNNRSLHIFNAHLKNPVLHLCEDNLDNELLLDALMELHGVMSALIESQVPAIMMPELEPGNEDKDGTLGQPPSIVTAPTVAGASIINFNEARNRS